MAAKRNPDYWKMRFEALEDDQYRKSAAYYKDVQKQFREASNSIQMDIERWYRRLADNNGVSYAGAKKLLKKNELDEFHWSVEQYIKAGEENAVDRRWMKELENASARHHISYLEVMKLQAQQHAELLSVEFEGGMTDFLHKTYGDQYYRSAFEMAKGTGVGSNLAKLDHKRIDVVIKKPWAQDGASFSERIWTNKQKLVNNLHAELAQSVIRGADPKQAVSSLAKIMEASRAQAGRLIMTESAAISSAAHQECFKDLGVGRYEVLATLDNRTSEICRGMDGAVFDMGDFKAGVTAPPFHPNCRSTTVPYFDDAFTAGEERAARNEDTGKTYYVPGDMKYGEWEDKYVPKMQDDSMTNKTRRNSEQLTQKAINIKEQLENYTSRDSKWSGEIEADTKKCVQRACYGQKEWNCNILLREDVNDGVILHELLHSCSVSYFHPDEFIMCRAVEEASVEFLTQEISASLGIMHDPAYPHLVGILRSVNEGLGLYSTDMEFAVELFGQPMTERFVWLQNEINQCIIHNDKISIEEAGNIMEYIEKLGGDFVG